MGNLLHTPIHFVYCHFLILALITVELRLCFSIPANFVFGDSLVDVGNNNYITSLSKADFIPNGIDFGKPTGRYTNGRTIVDIVGQEIGINGFIPPYLAPTTGGAAILQGVNYASGGGGILNHTGKIFGGRINLDAQLDNFANTRQTIISRIGEEAALSLLQNALFSVAIGSNDFINNYLTPLVSKLEQDLVSPQSFVAAMISRFTNQLMRLKSMGAKKIVVANVGPIGCIPYQREINPSAGNGNGNGNECVVLPNQLAQLFNAQLRSVVQQLNTNLDGSNFLYADVYHIVDDIIHNYTLYGFENSNTACCGSVGRFRGLIPCGPTSKVCEDRSKYVFWDPYHPTDAVNSIIAMRLMKGDSSDIWPINITQLLAN